MLARAACSISSDALTWPGSLVCRLNRL